MILTARIKPCWAELGSYILVLLIFWMILSTVFNGGTSESISYLVTGVGAIVFYFVGIFLAYRDVPGWGWETAIFLGALTAALIGLLHYMDVLPLFDFEKAAGAARSFAGYEFSGRGYKGLISASGDYDVWLLAGIMVAHRWLFRPRVKWWMKIAIMSAAIVMITADVVAQSRSGWIAISLFLLIYWIGIWTLYGKGASKRLRMILVLAVFAVVALLLFFMSGFGLDFIHALVSVKAQSVFARLEGYSAAVTQIANTPILGAGKFFADYHGSPVLVHNTVLSFMSSYGILSGGLFAVFCVFMIYKAFYQVLHLPDFDQRRECFATLAALLGVVVCISLFSGIGSKFFFALLGCMSGNFMTYSMLGRYSSKAG
jgi:O-antigen ligase